MNRRKELREACSAVVPYLNRTLLFSLATGVLVLAPGWYMLEVYDRVVNSRNPQTLFMLTLLVVGLYAMLEGVEWVRSMVMQEAGDAVDRKLQHRIFDAQLDARLKRASVTSSAQALTDLQTLRELLSSPPFLSIFDAPLGLLAALILFFMNPALCWFALAGALCQLVIGFFNEQRIRKPMAKAANRSIRARLYASDIFRKPQVIEAMGMLPALRDRWLGYQHEFLGSHAMASDIAGTNAALSKLVQSLVSSLLLGLGCWLALKGELSGAGMIVASILGGRLLSPLVVIIAGWRQFESAREAWERLDSLVSESPAEVAAMPLPPPNGRLTVENLQASVPGSPAQILKGLTFQVTPGDSVGVVGPSASGKTTLARLLVGAWKPASGKVRLDGSDITAWSREELGPYVGYLPQSVELFNGSVSENIARFGEIDEGKLRQACMLAGLDEFVAALSDGYDTRIGDDGAFLSGGQRQRIALARAIYGMPKFVVLDEPDASLDQAGDQALVRTLKALKAAGSTTIVMTHRMTLLSELDYLLVLVDGQIRQFGSSAQVLGTLSGARPAATQTVNGGGRS